MNLVIQKTIISLQQLMKLAILIFATSLSACVQNRNQINNVCDHEQILIRSEKEMRRAGYKLSNYKHQFVENDSVVIIDYLLNDNYRGGGAKIYFDKFDCAILKREFYQ